MATTVARYEGGLSGVGDGRVVGWVWNPAAHSERVAVTVVVDGADVAHGVAELYQASVEQAGKGDGAHSFRIALPDALRAAGRRRVRVLVGEQRAELAPSPNFWQVAAPDSGWEQVVFEAGAAELVEQPLPAAPPRSRPLQAVLGSGAWLFDAEEVQARVAPSEPELDALARTVVAITEQLRALGVTYLLATVPVKHEAIPGAAPSDFPGGRPWLRGLRARLRDHDDAEAINLTAAMRDAARHGACYHRSDVDWNALGAFFAARALMKEVAARVPAFRPPGRELLHLRPLPAHRGPLADAPKFVLVGDRLIARELDGAAEDGVALDPRALQARRMPVPEQLLAGDAEHVRLYTRASGASGAQAGAGNGPRLAVVGDSAALELLPWLAECAERTTFFWRADALPLAQLELELPHALLHVVREHELRQLTPLGAALTGG